MSNHISSQMYDCEAIQELVPEYAFGLTNSEESRVVESGLARCPEAAAQLADFLHLQEDMRAGVAQIEPPPQLGERLMAAIAAPAPVAKARRPFLRVHPAWLAVAAAVLVVLLTNIYWLGRVNDLSQQRDKLVASIDSQQNTAFVLTGTNNLRWVRLPPSEQNADSAAFMMWDAESEIGILYAHALPQLAAGKTYQLWLTRGDEFVNAGTVTVDQEGKGALLFHSKEPIDKYTWARITAESANGNTAPTGKAVVIGKLVVQ